MTSTFNRNGEFTRRALHRLHPTIGPSHTTTQILAVLLGVFDGLLLGPLTLNLGVPSEPEALQYIAGMTLGAAIGMLGHKIGEIVAGIPYQLDVKPLRAHIETWVALAGAVALLAASFAAGHIRADDSNTDEWVLDALQLLFVGAAVLLGFSSGDPNKAMAEDLDAKLDAAKTDFSDAKLDRDDAIDSTAEAAADTVRAGFEVSKQIHELLAGTGQYKAIANAKGARYEGALFPAAWSLAETEGELAEQLKKALEGDQIDRQVIARAFDEAGVTDICRWLLDFEAKVVMPVLTGVGAWAEAEAIQVGDELHALASKVLGVLSATEDTDDDTEDTEDTDLTDEDTEDTEDDIDLTDDAGVSSNGKTAP